MAEQVLLSEREFEGVFGVVVEERHRHEHVTAAEDRGRRSERAADEVAALVEALGARARTGQDRRAVVADSRRIPRGG